MINPRMTNMTGYIIDCPHAYMSILHYYDKIHQEINSYQSGDECLSSQHAGSRSGQISVNSKPVWSTLLVPDQQGYTMRSYLSNKPDHKEKSGIWLLSFNLVHQEGSVHHRDNIPSALAANKQKDRQERARIQYSLHDISPGTQCPSTRLLLFSGDASLLEHRPLGGAVQT